MGWRNVDIELGILGGLCCGLQRLGSARGRSIRPRP